MLNGFARLKMSKPVILAKSRGLLATFVSGKPVCRECKFVHHSRDKYNDKHNKITVVNAQKITRPFIDVNLISPVKTGQSISFITGKTFCRAICIRSHPVCGRLVQ
ncbi:MAG: hypothetical protein WBQ69_02475 [Gallionella sp.]